jgi:hypothetical protein
MLMAFSGLGLGVLFCGARQTRSQLNFALLPLPKTFSAPGLADGVGADENPVLPGREAAEDAGFHGFAGAEAQVGFHAGQRVGREAGALFEDDADFVFPVQVVRRGGDQAEFQRGIGAQRLADGGRAAAIGPSSP